MRIAYVAAGAAGMYCGTCLHDNTLAAALLARGHEVALVPTYTPLRTDERDVSIDRLFYGAINVYLQQKSALFRRTPAFLARLLDRPALLGWLSRVGAATDAHDLGALTLSVVRGAHGRQVQELARLVDWLGDFRPDVVQLTNSMFLGMAAEIKRRLGVPVVCGLTGEDLFLDELIEPYRSEVHAELRRLAAGEAGVDGAASFGGGAADAYIATSRYYADLMANYLEVDRKRIFVVPPGIHLGELPATAGSDRDSGQAADGGRDAGASGGPDGAAHAAETARPFVIGYLARVCPEKGLHLLLDAFRLLAEEGGGTAAARASELSGAAQVASPAAAGAPRPVRLRVAGYLGPRDRGYLAEQRKRAAGWGLAEAVDFVGEVDLAEKNAFLAGLDVLSVPTPYREPKGRFVIEALAHGVPVVQPRHGAFPELIVATGGGLLVEPGSPRALAAGLRQLRDDPALRRQLGRQGRAAVHQRFTAGALAEETVKVYASVLAGAGRRVGEGGESLVE